MLLAVKNTKCSKRIYAKFKPKVICILCIYLQQFLKELFLRLNFLIKIINKSKISQINKLLLIYNFYIDNT